MTLLYVHLRVCLLWDSLASRINGDRNCLPLLFIIILFIYLLSLLSNQEKYNKFVSACRTQYYINIPFIKLQPNRSARYYIGYMAAACIHIAYERHHVYAV